MKIKVYVNKEQPFLWATPNNYMGAWELGITPAALEDIGQITYVEPPVKGREYEVGDIFATIETNKGVWELKMPFAAKCFTEHKATVEAINADWTTPLGFFLLKKGFDDEGWEEKEMEIGISK